MHTPWVSSYSMTPLLSLNTDRHHGAAMSLVALAMVCLSRLSMIVTPSGVVYSTRPFRVLWTQCSDQVWASDSSSTSVGLRFRVRKCAWIACISSRVRLRQPSRDSCIRLESSSVARVISVRGWRTSPPGRRRRTASRGSMATSSIARLARHFQARRSRSSSLAPTTSTRVPMRTPTRTRPRSLAPLTIEASIGSMTPVLRWTSITRRVVAAGALKWARSITGSTSRVARRSRPLRSRSAWTR